MELATGKSFRIVWDWCPGCRIARRTRDGSLRIPLAIMTSDDTDAKRELLKEKGDFRRGAGPDHDHQAGQGRRAAGRTAALALDPIW